MSAIHQMIMATQTFSQQFLETPGLSTATDGAEGISFYIYWNIIPDASEYELQRRINGSAWTVLATIAASLITEYRDINYYTPGDVYEYRIKAVAADGTYSLWSNIATRIAPTPILAPVLAATFDNTNYVVNLSWNDVAAETSYEVRLNEFVIWVTLPENTTSYVFAYPITENYNWTFEVRGRNTTTGVIGPWSNIATINVPSLPFANVYAGSNSYLTFGFGTTTSFNLGPANPYFPKIMISAEDNSWQRIYSQLTGTAPNRFFRFRFEGSASASGNVGFPTLVWEAVFSEANPNRIDIHIGTNLRALGYIAIPAGVSGVYSADGLLSASFPGPLENRSYRIETALGSISVTPITFGIQGPVGMNLVREGSLNEGYTENTIGCPFPVQFLGNTYL